jgi:hypothetical protein
MKKSPLAAVKARFGEDRKAAKAELVKAVRAASAAFWTDNLAESDGLERASNAKLIRLENTFKTVKEKFASRDLLIAAVAEIEKRKDATYKVFLERQTTLQLWDRYKSVKRAAGPTKPTTPAADAKPAAKAAKPAKAKAPKAA